MIKWPRGKVAVIKCPVIKWPVIKCPSSDMPQRMFFSSVYLDLRLIAAFYKQLIGLTGVVASGQGQLNT